MATEVNIFLVTSSHLITMINDLFRRRLILNIFVAVMCVVRRFQERRSFGWKCASQNQNLFTPKTKEGKEEEEEKNDSEGDEEGDREGEGEGKKMYALL